jgi:transcriptional regulator with XRE-family HTH domain
MSDETRNEPPSLAERLDRLFRTVLDDQQKEYSHDDVARAIRKRGGPTISATYVWQLRKGLRDNPTKNHIEALAGFFGVPASYFFDDDDAVRIEEELELLAALRSAGVHQVAMRASGLSKAAISAIVDMIDIARRLEGLPEAHPEV